MEGMETESNVEVGKEGRWEGRGGREEGEGEEGGGRGKGRRERGMKYCGNYGSWMIGRRERKRWWTRRWDTMEGSLTGASDGSCWRRHQ